MVAHLHPVHGGLRIITTNSLPNAAGGPLLPAVRLPWQVQHILAQGGRG